MESFKICRAANDRAPIMGPIPSRVAVNFIRIFTSSITSIDTLLKGRFLRNSGSKVAQQVTVWGKVWPSCPSCLREARFWKEYGSYAHHICSPWTEGHLTRPMQGVLLHFPSCTVIQGNPVLSFFNKTHIIFWPDCVLSPPSHILVFIVSLWFWRHIFGKYLFSMLQTLTTYKPFVWSKPNPHNGVLYFLDRIFKERKCYKIWNANKMLAKKINGHSGSQTGEILIQA
jgi:hypothetical protein